MHFSKSALKGRVSHSKDASWAPKSLHSSRPHYFLGPIPKQDCQGHSILQAPGSIADFHWDVHNTRWLASGARLIALQPLQQHML